MTVWEDASASDISNQAVLIREFAELLADRPRLSTLPNHRRQSEAENYVVEMLDLLRRACGEDVVREAYGSEATYRHQALELLSRRLQVASYIFGGFDRGMGSLNDTAAEARAVAQGDLPELFAKGDGRRKNIRLLRRKFDALRWDAWGAGAKIPPSLRHDAISTAYNHPWDTISRWKSDILSQWGREIETELHWYYADGARGLPCRLMIVHEDWLQGLKRSGSEFSAALNAGR